MAGFNFSKSKGSNYSNSQESSSGAPGVWDPAESYLLGAMQRLDEYGWQPEYYRGATVADESDWTRYGDDSMAKAADNVADLNVHGQAAWKQALNAADLRSNPYVQQYADALRGRMHSDQARNQYRLSQQFNEELMPGVRGGAAKAGGIGGSRQAMAEAVAMSRTSRDMQDYLRGSTADVNAQMGDLFNNAYNTGVQARGQALGYTEMMNKAAAQPAMMRYGIGQRQEQRQQDLINADKERWDFAQNAPWQKLQQYAGIMGQITPTGQDTKSNSSTTSRGKNSSFGFGIGA